MKSEWKKNTLGALCEKPQYGYTASASADEVGPKFLRITDITPTGVDWKMVPHCECSSSALEICRLAHNDILIARIGGTTGKSFIVKEPPLAVFASYLIRLRSLSGICPDFIFYSLQTESYWSQVRANKDKNIKGGVNAPVLSGINLYLPPLPEQKRIAAVLLKIQKAIETQEKLIASLRDLKKSAMQRIFTRGLRGEKTRMTEIGEIPESWGVEKLQDLCEKPTYGYTASASFEQIGPRLLRITDITDRGVNWETVPYCSCPDEKAKSYKLFHNDILFARIGATTGKSFLVKNPPTAVYASYLIRVRAKPFFSAKYLSYFCQTDFYWHQINANKNNNLKGGVNGSVLAKLAVCFPKKESEQEQVATVFDHIDMNMNIHESNKSTLQSLFRTTLNKLMTGEIRVADLNIDMKEVEG